MRTGCYIRRGFAACLLICFLCAALALAAEMIWPSADGTDSTSEGGLTVDASHAASGYIMAAAEGSSRLKLRIALGDEIYTYDLNGEGRYEVFPLQMGSGRYECMLYRNVEGNKYAKDADIGLDVTLESDYAPFLCPSQYVNYSEDSPAVQKSMELCQNLTGDAEKLEAIRSFMLGQFVYDYVRALTIKEAYLGDIDGCFESKRGLCQDLAAIAACMLRVQGIPTQLVVGYADETYHAWNNVLIDGEYRRLDITGELSGLSKNTVYTAERYY